MSELKPDYCVHCGTVQPMTARLLPGGTFIECDVCHQNVDIIWDDDEDEEGE